MITGLWLIVTGMLIALPAWRLRDADRVRALLAENRRVLGGRFGSSRTTEERWVEYMRKIASTCAFIGGGLSLLGLVWFAVAAVGGLF